MAFKFRVLLLYVLVLFCVLYALFLTTLHKYVKYIETTKVAIMHMIGSDSYLFDVQEDNMKLIPFPSNPMTFDVGLSMYMAFLLSSYYERPAHVYNGLTKLTEFGSQNGVMFMNDNQRTVYCIFRGSLSNEEWKLNLQFSQTPMEKCSNSEKQSDENDLSEMNNGSVERIGCLHTGFLKTYNGFRNVIMETLMSLPDCDRIVCLGYSLGAALATLLVTDPWIKHKFQTVCFAVASPRVGDTMFVRHNQSSPIFRIVNQADIINDIPWAIMPNYEHPDRPYLYQHIGQPIEFYTNHGEFIVNHSLSTYMEGLKTMSEEK